MTRHITMFAAAAALALSSTTLAFASGPADPTYRTFSDPAHELAIASEKILNKARLGDMDNMASALDEFGSGSNTAMMVDDGKVKALDSSITHQAAVALNDGGSTGTGNALKLEDMSKVAMTLDEGAGPTDQAKALDDITKVAIAVSVAPNFDSTAGAGFQAIASS